MKQILFHPLAEKELWDSFNFYENLRSGLGVDFEKEVSDSLRIIQLTPKLWSLKEWGTRSCVLQQFPFILHYLETEELLWIVAIAHTSKKPNYWINRQV